VSKRSENFLTAPHITLYLILPCEYSHFCTCTFHYLVIWMLLNGIVLMNKGHTFSYTVWLQWIDGETCIPSADGPEAGSKHVVDKNNICWRMVSSGMLRHVVLVTDVSKELSASFIRVTRIGELGTTLAVTSNRCTLRRNTLLWNVGSYKSHMA
jgi:hypothetical protein